MLRCLQILCAAACPRFKTYSSTSGECSQGTQSTLAYNLRYLQRTTGKPGREKFAPGSGSLFTRGKVELDRYGGSARNSLLSLLLAIAAPTRRSSTAHASCRRRSVSRAAAEAESVAGGRVPLRPFGSPSRWRPERDAFIYSVQMRLQRVLLSRVFFSVHHI